MTTTATTTASLVVSRRVRHPGDDPSSARSFFGGAPLLGLTPWPRGKDGKPLPFLAQIDLAEVAAVHRVPSLPVSGALAFFVGKVVYVPAASALTRARVPADLPPLSEAGGDPHYPGNLVGQQLFPLWPVEFTPIEVTYDEETGEDDEADVLAEVFGFTRRSYNLSAKEAFSGQPVPNWWQNAIHYAEFLTQKLQSIPKRRVGEEKQIEWSLGQIEEARAKGAAELKKVEGYVALYRKRVADLDRQVPAFETHVSEIVAWSRGRDPWAVMSEEEWRHLAALWAANPKYPLITDYSGNPGVQQLKDMMFAALPDPGKPGFDELPAHVQELIVEKRAPRPMWWHTAMLLSRLLQAHAERQLPHARAKLETALAAERAKLARLLPGGALASLTRMVSGNPKDIADQQAKVAMHEAKLAKHDDAAAQVQRIAAEAAHFVRDREPWAPMAADEITKLGEIFKSAKEKATYALPYGLDSLETLTLYEMAAASASVYETLPVRTRALIEGPARLPSGPCHRMFGRPISIQDYAASQYDEGNILLLQLSYDDLMHWSFGDNGAYSYFISPADLARGNWDGVKMGFECH